LEDIKDVHILENLVVDGRIILNRTSKSSMGGCSLDLYASRKGILANDFENLQ
jgi:hypothetical protein